MTPYASVALYRRGGEVIFKPPRKERVVGPTQARKTAVRYWRGSLTGDDVLLRVVIVREFTGKIEVSERLAGGVTERQWTDFTIDAREAMGQPHLAACLAELGIDPDAAPTPLPDTLEINGAIYRREI